MSKALFSTRPFTDCSDCDKSDSANLLNRTILLQIIEVEKSIKKSA